MKIFKTPIYLINRNRLESLKTLIDWLRNAGFNNIKILDNQSTYPPLVDYYTSIEGDIEVIRLNKNFGPWVFWQLGMHKKIDSNYIVSDSDLYPSEFCPVDLINYMNEILETNLNIKKVAPGINLETISSEYNQKELVERWESQFWHKPVGKRLFAAGVDTTFALYRIGVDFNNNSSENIRLGYPQELLAKDLFIPLPV